MHQETFNIEAAIIAVTIVLLILGSFLVMITMVYRKRRNTQLTENMQLRSAFNQELLKARNEIQEQTLTHVSREIHDNITQVLSFVKLNLAMAHDLSPEAVMHKVNESRALVARAITDLRDISKSMSYEHILQLGLVNTIEIETGRITKSGIIEMLFSVIGDTYPLGGQRELVLFRIFQEALNNTLKHSGAKLLKISLQYSLQLFTLTIEDDGAGFLPDELEKNGAGLKNMRNRATLIGAVFTLNSGAGKGCCIKITIDPLQQMYADGNDPNSAG